MPTLSTTVDPRSPFYMDNRRAMLVQLDELDEALRSGRDGYHTVARPAARTGARERVELLLDRDAPFLELCPLAGWGTEGTPGAGIVGGIGPIEGVPCLIIATDPTVPGGLAALRKSRRLGEIAVEHRLPLIYLLDAGAAHTARSDGMAHAGWGDSTAHTTPGGRAAHAALGEDGIPAVELAHHQVLRDLARAGATRLPSIAVVFGGPTEGVAGQSECTILVRPRTGKADQPADFGPADFEAGTLRPRTSQADLRPTGFEMADFGPGGFKATDFGAGDFGAGAVRSRTGLAEPRVDYRPADFEATAVSSRINQAESRADHEAVDAGAVDLIAEDERDAVRLARLCVRRLNRCGDGSTGFGAPPRYDQDELLGLASAEPREILARLLDGSGFDEFQPGYGAGLVAGWGELHGYPLGVLAGGHTDGQRAARKAARFIRRANSTGTPLLFLDSGGVDDPTVVQAVATSAVPHLTLNIGGAGGMCGRAYRPRFLFSWPRAGALELSGRLFDDGVIDPRDTRTALGIALSVAAGRAQ